MLPTIQLVITAFEAQSGRAAGSSGAIRVSGPGDLSTLLTSIVESDGRQIDLPAAQLAVWRSGRMLRAGAGLTSSAPAATTGIDPKLGPFQELSQSWTCAGEELQGPCLVTAVRVLKKHAAVIWRQQWPRGTSGTPSLGTTTQTICPFPAFASKLAANNAANSSAEPALHLSDLGFVTWTGEFAVTPAWRAGRFPADYGRWPGDWGMYAGPLSLFDETGGRSLVLGPLTGFTASVNTLHDGSGLSAGPHGMIEELPAGYTLDTALVLGSGFVATQMDYGSLLLQEHGKQRPRPNVSEAVKSLMYSADGYPYYDPASGNSTCGNYEDLYLEIDKANRAQGLPYHTSMLDSFWYGQAVNDGVWKWDASSPCFDSRFPHGLPWLHKQLGVNFVAHLGTWLKATPYAENYPFVDDPLSLYALPTDAAFWVDLFRNATKGPDGWGLSVMKQDHQDQQMGCAWNHGSPKCHRWPGLVNPTVSSNWLSQMAAGAKESGVTIEYGTTIARFVLNTVTLPAVTHARGANDYSIRAANDSWRVGAASGLFWSVGLYTTKDTFFSSANETTPRGPLHGYFEQHPELHALVSALSAGPVSPSDAPGRANVSLIMRTCRADGELLKPDAPAMPLDRFWIGHAFCKGKAGCPAHEQPPQGELWATATRIGDSAVWPIVFAALTSDYALPLPSVFHHLQGVPTLHRDGNLATAKYQPPKRGWVMYRPGAALTLAPPRLVSANATLNLTAGRSFWDFQLAVLAPVVSAASGGGPDWAMLGETDKFIPVSRQRIRSIASDRTKVLVTLVGSAREVVTLRIAIIGAAAGASGAGAVKMVAEVVTLDEGGDGTATFDLKRIEEIL